MDSPHLVPGLSSTEVMNSLLLVGRQDYTVRSLRVDTQAETWNATFARMHVLQAGIRNAASFLAGTGGVVEPSLPDGRSGAPGGSEWWILAAGCI